MRRETIQRERRWPDHEVGPWRINVTWAMLGGRAEPVGIELTRGIAADGSAFGAGPSPVLASEVRAIPLASVIQGLGWPLPHEFEERTDVEPVPSTGGA